jgi:hypothetical protein
MTRQERRAAAGLGLVAAGGAATVAGIVFFVAGDWAPVGILFALGAIAAMLGRLAYI